MYYSILTVKNECKLKNYETFISKVSPDSSWSLSIIQWSEIVSTRFIWWKCRQTYQKIPSRTMYSLLHLYAVHVRLYVVSRVHFETKPRLSYYRKSRVKAPFFHPVICYNDVSQGRPISDSVIVTRHCNILTCKTRFERPVSLERFFRSFASGFGFSRKACFIAAIW